MTSAEYSPLIPNFPDFAVFPPGLSKHRQVVSGGLKDAREGIPPSRHFASVQADELSIPIHHFVILITWMEGGRGVHGKNGEKHDAFFDRRGAGVIDRGVQSETGR
mgnify:CR=1 FL=1